MKILLATDLSASAARAHDLIRAVAWPAASTVRVLTILEPRPAHLGGALPEEAFDEGLEQVQGELAILARELADTTRVIERAVGIGRPCDEIIEDARATRVDLIVMGNRGRGPLASDVLGSVSAEVSQRASVPVLVARRPALRTLLVADDGSAEAQAAVTYLASLRVGGLSAEVMSVATARDGDAARAEATARTSARVLGAAGIQATWRVGEGDVVRALTDEAESIGADTIVVGTRGRSGIARLVLGSVARSLVTHGSASVLVVPPLAAERARAVARDLQMGVIKG